MSDDPRVSASPPALTRTDRLLAELGRRLRTSVWLSGLGTVLGAIGIVALIALAANSDSVKVCSPSPCPEE